MKSDLTVAVQQVIVDWISSRSSVLDLGCGNGELLATLVREKQVNPQGIESDNELVHLCVQKGLSVLHEDVDEGLAEYGDRAFDYVVLNESLQRAVKKPDLVIRGSLRVGRKAILAFSNFAHYKARWQLGWRGRTPITRSLPYEWHDTPNLHFLSIADFAAYCRETGVLIERSAFFGYRGRVQVFPNLRALTAVLLISRHSREGR